MRDAAAGTAHGRLTERSAGKDTTTGHWEMTGIVLSEPFPLYRVLERNGYEWRTTPFPDGRFEILIFERSRAGA